MAFCFLGAGRFALKVRSSWFLLIGLILFSGNSGYSLGDPTLPSKDPLLRTPPSIQSSEGQAVYKSFRECADASNVYGVENNIDEIKEGLPSAVIAVCEKKENKEPRIMALLPKPHGHVDEVEFNPNFPGSKSSSGKILALDIWKNGKTFPGQSEFFIHRENKRHEWYTLFESESGIYYKQMFEYENHKAKTGEIKTIYAGAKPENELHVMIAKEDTSTSDSTKLTLESGFRVLLAIPEENSNSESTTKAKRLAVYAIRKDPVSNKEAMIRFVYELEKGPKFTQIIKEEVSDSTRDSFLVHKKSHQPEVLKESSQPSKNDGSK